MALNVRYIVILFLVLFTACQREQWDDCITSTGPERQEYREVAGFHSIDLNDRIDLVFDHLPATTIHVEAGRNLMDQVRTEVRDSVLYISNDNRCNWVRSFKPRIIVKVPIHAVKELTLRGTGNIHSNDTMVRSVFRLEQWGAMGTADLFLNVDRLFIGLHTGAGDVILAGRARTTNFYSGMLGSIEATHLLSSVVNINNDGVGDMRCRVDSLLNVQIQDAGDVYYSGDPIVASQINGSGSLIKLD